MDTKTEMEAVRKKLAESRWQIEAMRNDAAPEQRQLLNSAIKYINNAMTAINAALEVDAHH